MQTKFGIDVERDGGKVCEFHGAHVGDCESYSGQVPCEPLEYDTVTQPIQANTVASTKDVDGSQRLTVCRVNVEVCELGEHCRCKSFDVAYQQDCWNWIGKVML